MASYYSVKLQCQMILKAIAAATSREQLVANFDYSDGGVENLQR